jgi:cation diffusion facilitator CzcD-associated flavoprotein CzcO
VTAEDTGPRFVIIGAGMAGLMCSVKLLEAGLSNFIVYEKADRLGGTWRENTYPGIACDVPSHLYSYSFAPNPEWSHVFSAGDEICAYLESVANRYGVDKYVVYGAEVSRLEFDHGRWRIELADGRRDEADFVIAATGVLHHPNYPAFEGLDDFAGAVFHSARWDHTVPIAGQRVGVIGTGSSAVQIVSAVASTVGDLRLFQRTAQWIMSVPNPPIDEETRQTYRSDPSVMNKVREGLSSRFEELSNAVVDADSPRMQLIEELCRANLEENVADPDLREKLRPDYRAACKRLVMSPTFYQAIQHPNSTVVTEAIMRIEPAGVRTEDGQLHELDVLVLATGFRVDRFLRPIEVTGRGGVRLDDVWSERPSAYLSVSIPEFPNLFLLNGPNGPVGNFSLIDVAELEFGYVMQLVDLVRSGVCREVCAFREATDRFEADRIEAAQRTIWATGCRSWYLDDRGVPAAWPWGFDRFRRAMSRPTLADFQLVT